MLAPLWMRALPFIGALGAWLSDEMTGDSYLAFRMWIQLFSFSRQ